MDLLLHACCGPCSIMPIEHFLRGGDKVTVAYSNSNIQPENEYIQRRDALMAYTQRMGVEFLEGDYDPHAWQEQVGQYGSDVPARCRACYRFRFDEIARSAKENRFDAISTTLTISPYQFTDVIEEELSAAAQRYGLKAQFKDFRDYYPEATRRSRELGMYRQNYCGCLYSKAEAEGDRERRRAERKAQKEAKRREAKSSL